MSDTVYTYTFPFNGKDTVSRIVAAALNIIPSSLFSHKFRFADNASFVLAQSTNSLELLIPEPLFADESSLSESDNSYSLILFRLKRYKPATLYESINIYAAKISCSQEEYEAFTEKRMLAGTASMALEVIRSGNPEELFTSVVTIEPHGSFVGPRNVSMQTQRAMHWEALMKQLGVSIGEYVWNSYAEKLSDKILPTIGIQDKDFKLFRLVINRSEITQPNSQYVGVWKNNFIIVAEEAYYSGKEGEDAVPRYALIPVSSFGGNAYAGVSAIKNLGLDALASPGVAEYMRIRPTLAAPSGLAIANVLREAVGFAEKRSGSR